MGFKGTKGNWRIGNHFSNIVTDEKPHRPTYSEKDWQSEKEYYGGYIVAESISKKADANLIAAAPDLLIALSEIIELEHSEDLNLKFDAMYNAKQAIKKALGNE